MPTAHLSDRTAILVEGPDAEHFLQNILTTDLDKLGRQEARPGALLTPQGKILFDFLISRRGEAGFLLDCRADIADDFVRRLMLYRLRARAEISRHDELAVRAYWNGEAVPPAASDWLADRRFPSATKVFRAYGADASADASQEEFARLRIMLGIAESGADFALGDVFPHDVLLDQTDGVGFRKGCYVGQEVVSRMQHRGTARRRIMLVESEADLPEAGTELRANGRAIGTLGGTGGTRGLAIVRIDRVKDALDAGHAIEAGDVGVTVSIPEWATYTLPKNDTNAEEA